MLDPAPANSNPFASNAEAYVLVCLDLKNALSFHGIPACFPDHSFPLSPSLARLNTPNAPHFQARSPFRALKFHTLNIVRGI